MKVKLPNRKIIEQIDFNLPDFARDISGVQDFCNEREVRHLHDVNGIDNTGAVWLADKTLLRQDESDEWNHGAVAVAPTFNASHLVGSTLVNGQNVLSLDGQVPLWPRTLVNLQDFGTAKRILAEIEQGDPAYKYLAQLRVPTGIDPQLHRVKTETVACYFNQENEEFYSVSQDQRHNCVGKNLHRLEPVPVTRAADGNWLGTDLMMLTRNPDLEISTAAVTDYLQEGYLTSLIKSANFTSMVIMKKLHQINHGLIKQDSLKLAGDRINSL